MKRKITKKQMELLIDPLKEYAKEYAGMVVKIVRKGKKLGLSDKEICDALNNAVFRVTLKF